MQRWARLKHERQTWEPDVRDIAQNMSPYRIVENRQSKLDRNRGHHKNDRIINSTPVEALRILAAGMMAGITSPARKWFDFTVTDSQLADKPAVRAYLDQVQRIVSDMLQASNWYDALASSIYPDLGSIATAAMFHDETNEGGIHFNDMTWGEYWLDHNHEKKVDVAFHEQPLTVRQIVKDFGLENVSGKVRIDWNANRLNNTYRVLHAVIPNDEVDTTKAGPEGMRWRSYWWEIHNPNKTQFLRVSGYNEFPVLAPRWSSRGVDVYGRGPGWTIRGDCLALQHRETRLAQMIDKTSTPPMFLSGKATKLSMLPGAVTQVPAREKADAKPLVDILPGSLEQVRLDIATKEATIKAIMFVNLFQAAINDQKAGRATATEVEAISREVMIQLGPLLQALNTELLEPAINRTFAIADRNGRLPIPPEELQGTEAKVSFISILHQAQQATGAAGLRSLLAETAAATAIDPTVVDKINTDAVVDSFGRMFGVDAGVIRSDEEVEEIRQGRAAAQAAQQQQEQVAGLASAAKDVSQVDVGNVGEVLDAISPVAGAQAAAETVGG